MADSHALRAGVLLSAVGVLLLAVASPAATLAASGQLPVPERIAVADAPPGAGEDCVDDPAAHPGTGLRECPKGFDIVSLLPFAAGGVAVLLVVVAGWFLVMRRRVSRPFLPDQEFSGTAAGGTSDAAGPTTSGEWWTCRTCGKTNMVGSARCYSCGSWQR